MQFYCYNIRNDVMIIFILFLASRSVAYQFGTGSLSEGWMEDWINLTG